MCFACACKLTRVTYLQVWCDGDDAGAPLEESSQSSGNSTLSQELVDVVSAAQLDFTLNPTSAPQITGQPSHEPSAEPTQQPTTRSPTNEPVSNQQEIPPWLQDVINNEIYCFSEATYDEIDADIEQIKNGIADAQERSHFLGGIVRLAVRDLPYRPRFSHRPNLTFRCMHRPMTSWTTIGGTQQAMGPMAASTRPTQQTMDLNQFGAQTVH